MRNIILLLIFFLNNQIVEGQSLKYDSSKFTFIKSSKTFNTIEDILKLNQFKNKIVYIDLWGYGCAACMKEFEYMPAIRNKYNKNQVAYLFIYYKHADSISENILNNYWIKYSIDKKLYGTHLLAYIKPPQQINNGHILTIRETQTITLDEDMYAIPRYMIADKTGKITVFDAPKPNEREKLFATINKLLKP